jgi:hypothetical protein
MFRNRKRAKKKRRREEKKRTTISPRLIKIMSKKIKFDFNHLAHRTLEDIGDVLVEQGKTNMDKVSFGRVYIIGGKPHIASKVGDSPNNLTGDLKSSIRYEIEGKIMEYGSGDGKINYAKYLEPDRPNITKAITQNESKISASIEKLFIDSLRVANA